MPSQEFTFKTDQFLQAIAEYSAGLNKDFAYSVNRQMRNAAIKAVKLAPVADVSKIERLRTPQFAAYWLSKKPKQRVRVKYKAYTGKLTKNWSKKYKSYYRWVWRSYSRQEAKKYLRSVIGRRRAARTFVMSFFSNFAAIILEKVPGLGGSSGGKRKSGYKSGFIPATPDDPKAYGTVSYEYKHSSRSKIAVDRMLEQAWIGGMDAAMADMKQYLESKMSEKAREHSVK